jgi:chromosome segregation ATPase
MEPFDVDWDKFEAEGREIAARMRAVSAEMQRQNAISRASRAGGSSIAREQPPPYRPRESRLDRFERMLAETLNVVTVLQRDVSGLTGEVGGLKADVSQLTADVNEVKADVNQLKADVNELKTDVSQLKADVNELKTDVSQLKADVSQLKADVNELRTDVNELRADVNELRTDVNQLKADVTGLKADVADIRERMATKVELESFRESINMVADGFAQTQARLEYVGGLLKRYLTA